MAKNPAFPFYANDYLVDTLRWSRGMKSLHIDLMAESWSNKVIQDDGGYPKGLSSEDRLLWDDIKHKWVLTDGVWSNPKLEESRAERKRFLERQGKNGQKGGRPSKYKPTDNPRVSSGLSKTKPKRNPLEGEEEREEEDQNKKEQAESLELWTRIAIEGNDYVLQKMERMDAGKTGVPWPPGFDRTKAILDHQDLARRYKWTFDDQQDFRHSLLKVLRDSKKSHSNGAIKSTSKKQQHTAELVAAHTRKYGGGAEHPRDAEGNIQVDGPAT